MKKFVYIFIGSILGLALLAGTLVAYVLFWPPSAGGEKAAFKVKWGTSFQEATDSLVAQGIVHNRRAFELAARLLGWTHRLKAGVFELTPGSSNYRILKDLTQGPQSYIRITIPEGSRTRYIASLLQRELEVDSVRIMALVHDSTFIAKLGLDAPSLDGYLFPETYQFTYGLNEEQILTALVQQFKKNVPDSLYRRAEELGFTMNEILTLASIIEGEAMIDSEMVYISSVYHNRLKKGIRLQADPTIQYIIPDGPRRLLNRDLKIDSPYNTYLYPGLPPGPINNPGRKAILAALYPAKTNYLYFVADGRGGHVFSATLGQHLKAKKNFDVIRRRVAREKRRAAKQRQGGNEG